MRSVPNVIFVVRSGLLGDTLVAIPSLVAIRKLYPDAQLVYIGERVKGAAYVNAGEVLRGTGLADDFLYFCSGGFSLNGLWSLALLAWETLKRRPQAVIVLEAPGRYTRKARFFRVFGLYPIYFATESSLQFKQARSEPIARQLLDIVGMIRDGANAREFLNAELPVRPGSSITVEQWFTEVGPCIGKRIIGIGLWSNMPAKRWPVERYAELISRVLRSYPNVFPIVVGGGDEREVGVRLVERWGTGAVAAGRFSIHESAYLLSKCTFYLGNDTGTMHLAASVGTSCVALFSARDQPGKWFPGGPAHHVVIRKDVSCAGCMLRECMEMDLKCMREISIDEVFACCEAILNERSRES